jgi:hypothetical protein
MRPSQRMDKLTGFSRHVARPFAAVPEPGSSSPRPHVTERERSKAVISIRTLHRMGKKLAADRPKWATYFSVVSSAGYDGRGLTMWRENSESIFDNHTCTGAKRRKLRPTRGRFIGPSG